MAVAEFVDNWRDRWLDFLDWFDEVGGRRKAVGVAVVVALLAGIGFWQLRPDSGSDESVSASGESESVQIASPISAPDEDAGASSDDDSVTTTDRTAQGASDVDSASSTSEAPPTEPTEAGSTVPAAEASDAATASTTTTVLVESAGPVPAPSTPEAPDAGASPPAVEAPLGYPTSPDGAPLPLLVVFDTETVTISGQVPSQAAKDRLTGLAIANSQFPDAEVVDNMVINPAVPISVGARVIELNSARFPPGTADILPEHALELDRVANIMNLLPNISVVVIGHADQRGDDVTNFAISDQRARAVVNYLIYLGIPPARLASRAAGEADLLTLDDDDASLALNRRTEFIFTGLLVE